MITKTLTQDSYEATITFISENGYGEPEYRVKVTFNKGENLAFLKSYNSQKAAERALSREFKRVAA